MAFDASKMPQVNLALSDIFLNPTMVDAELNHPTIVSDLLCNRQRTRFEAVRKASTTIGMQINFLTSGQSTVTHNDTTVPADGCDVPDGVPLQTLSEVYTPNVSIKTTCVVEEQRDDHSDAWYAMELARAFATAMKDARVIFDRDYAIPLLTNNVQPNQMNAVLTAEYGFSDQGTGNRLKASPASFDFTLYQYMKILASLNDITSPIFINGHNFYADQSLAEVRALNDNGRADLALYNKFESYFDERNLDQTLGRQSTFIVNPGVIGAYTVEYAPATPTITDASKNMMEMLVDDPNWTINYNGQTIPVRYNVTHVKKCIRTNANGKRIWAHTFDFHLRMGLHIAPLGFNKAAPAVQELSGIMEIVKEA